MEEITILAVDDEPIIREMLKTALNKAGYSVRLAKSAEESLDILAQESFPLIFVDLGLEKMSGFELCENIKRNKSDVAVYALTGYAGLFGEQEIVNAGFDGCIAKPVKIDTLINVTNGFFEKLYSVDSPKTIKRILIVDDEIPFRQMLSEKLAQEGYEVMAAVNRNEMINHYSEQPADLIIIADMCNPGRNGVEAILDIKRKDPSVQFISISDNCDVYSDIECDMADKLGARTFRRPIDIDSILDEIKKYPVMT